MFLATRHHLWDLSSLTKDQNSAPTVEEKFPDPPDPGIEPMSPAWQADSLLLSHGGELVIRTQCN